tara:strand:- start:681 stop:1601 length:921 start_codon:yes stop_codon:yes gene_type:complete
MKILDLFAGIGGFSYAAHNLVGGYTTTQFVEIDPYCQSVLRKNFPNIPIHDDIKTFKGKPKQFDVLTAGFPCQDLSVAGKQRGIGEGTRSGLFYEIIRLLGEIQPEFVLFENVRNLLSHENGTTFQEVLFQIAKAGYDAEWSLISARDMGACHLRQRLWILAYPTGKYKNRTESSIQTRRDATVGFSTANSNKQGLEGRILQVNQELQEVGSSAQEDTSSTSNSNSQRTQSLTSRQTTPIWTDAFLFSQKKRTLEPDWRRYVSEPTLRRGDDGLSGRVARLKALGNSIVPNCAAVPLQRIKDLRSL